jgi:hypothetical protein
MAFETKGEAALFVKGNCEGGFAHAACADDGNQQVHGFVQKFERSLKFGI